MTTARLARLASLSNIVVWLAVAAIAAQRSRFVVDVDRYEPFGHLGVAAAATFALGTSRVIDRRMPGLVTAACAVIAITTLLEVLQLRSPPRDFAVGDIACNVVGVGLGAAGALAARRAGLAALAICLVSSLIAGLAIGTFVLLPPDRPEHCGHDTIAPSDTRRPDLGEDGLAVAYDFTRPNLAAALRPTVGDPAFALSTSAENIHSGDRGLVTSDAADDAVISSPAAGRALAERIRSTNHFAVEVVVQPDGYQYGPARIVSISAGAASDRVDLHLGQEEDDLTVRIGLRCGSPNTFYADDGFVDPDGSDVLVVFADGVMYLWIGEDFRTARAYRGDATTADWNVDWPLLVGNELTGDRVFRGAIRSLRIWTNPTVSFAPPDHDGSPAGEN